MHRVGSTRPPLISSISKFCRYSTEKPTKPRELVTEWRGISIPSLTEMKEKARQREQAKKPLDISYLKNAPQNSLAGRLARRTHSQPKPVAKVQPLAPEAVKILAEKRRETRIARETADANATLRRFQPSSALTKVVNAAAENSGPLPTFLNRRIEQTPRPGELNDRRRTQPSSTPALRKAGQITHSPRPERTGQTKRDLETQTTSISGIRHAKKEGNAFLPVPPENVLDQYLSEDQNPAASEVIDMNTEGVRVVHSAQQFNLAKSHLTAIEKRREERLRRERDRANEVKFSNKRGNTNVSKRNNSLPQVVPSRPARGLPEIDAEIDQSNEEDTITAGFTGPEPISITLAELFNTSPTLRYPTPIMPPSILVAGDYSRYIPASTEALFSTPAQTLSPVDIATVALSHRADISIPKRTHALSIITAATQARSTKAVARA